ncbi:MAG: CopG family transcriptional regulator [Candidatus Omnitrophica bacterium]|nr:CopG family transcriptional regulator [Candidatus Omnitrophota bacterium]MBU1997249.1 CopG family transcriptional regulator [Candidatus Omnitrophota bacterium]MBU4333499.1 CopG family transcriptional regulator [Candidatus Omnitrophota bacterium]
MIKLSKRVTVYFDPKIHKILKVRALETDRSISEIINDAIYRDLMDDNEDLEAFKLREKESTVSYEALLKELKEDGKI